MPASPTAPIARFLSLPNKRQHLLLGPWDHGARANVSPFRDAVEPRFNVLAEVLRFFDHYLMGRDTGLRPEAPVHYFSMRAEVWCAAPGWPPVGSTRTLHLAAAGALADVPGSEGEDRYKVDFTVGTGANTRHERLAAEDTRDYYGDWQGRDARMLRYTSEPLSDDAEVSGHPVVDLWLSSSEGDAAVHVYLSEVEEDGTVRYVTRRRAARHPPQGIRARAGAALELALSDLRARRCDADAEGRAAAPALRAAADLLDLQARQPASGLRSPARTPTTTPRCRMGARRC